MNAVPEENDDVPEDVVISQDPPGNAEVAPNATITIKVSSGFRHHRRSPTWRARPRPRPAPT